MLIFIAFMEKSD